MSITQPSAAAGSVTSADGTTIGYRRTGDGPGVVLVHGGGQSSQNLMTLAAALSDRFTVYVLVTIMKGTADRTAFRLVPRFLLSSALSHVMRKTEGRPLPDGIVSPRDLIPTMHYDARTVLDAAGALNRFAGLSCDVLLLGGSRSARNLTAALDGLSAVLPRARRVTRPVPATPPPTTAAGRNSSRHSCKRSSARPLPGPDDLGKRQLSCTTGAPFR
jgi:hypothetical protein